MDAPVPRVRARPHDDSLAPKRNEVSFRQLSRTNVSTNNKTLHLAGSLIFLVSGGRRLYKTLISDVILYCLQGKPVVFSGKMCPEVDSGPSQPATTGVSLCLWSHSMTHACYRPS